MAQSGFHCSLQCLQDAPARRADRQEGAVGRAAFRPQGRQHDGHDLVVTGERLQERLVEGAGGVELRRGLELVVEAEGIEKRPEAGIVVGAEALMGAEGIGDAGQGLAQVGCHQLLIRDIVRHLAQAVHVVGKAEQPGREVRKPAEGLAHHGGAHHLAEGADVGQARGAVAGLEQDVALFRRRAGEAVHQLARLDEGPGAGLLGKGAFFRRNRAIFLRSEHAAGP
jgi:hypothetical protein